MEHAVERIRKSIRDYRAGGLTRSVATIELVSAFKVVCKKSGLDPKTVEASVQHFIERLLERLDESQADEGDTVSELTRVYEAAFHSDPKLEDMLGGHNK